MDQTAELSRCSVSALIAAANRAGVHYFLPPVANAYYPTGRLMVWNHRDPAAQRIVDAMRARREEIAASLSASRPAPLKVDPAEGRFRRDVLREPDADIPLSEFTWSTIASVIRAEVWKAMDQWRGERGCGSSVQDHRDVTDRREWRMRL